MDITSGSHFSLNAGISHHLPWGAQIALRWLHEFEAEEHFKGVNASKASSWGKPQQGLSMKDAVTH